MAYETGGEVMLGVYSKLLKQRDNAMKKLQELTLQLKFLDKDYYDSALYQKLEKEKENTENKLADVELQLDIINSKRNGGASLDPFFGVKSKIESDVDID